MTPEYQRVGSGAPIIYLPGIEGTGTLFYKQAEDLKKDHAIITYPYRSGRYQLHDLISDLQRIVEDAGFQNVTLLGESFGGLVTLSFALEHPDLIDRLVLVNAFPWFQERLRINLGVALFSIMPTSVVRAYRRHSSRKRLFSDDIALEDRELYDRYTQNSHMNGYISRLRIVRTIDLRSRLADIQAPVLVVASTADRLVGSVEAARLLVENLPRARLKLLEGTGHTALLSSKVKVREWLSEFDHF